MLTQDEIRQKALEHLEAKPFPDPDYCRVLKDGRELDDYWYFDYSFENLLGLPESEWSGFGGAPGFFVG